MKALSIFLAALILYINVGAQTVCKVWDYSNFRRGEKEFVDVSWTGDVRGGKADGRGTAYFDNLKRFEGNFVKGVPQGPGKFLVRSGSSSRAKITISNWTNGIENGQTTEIFYPTQDLGSGYYLKYVSGNCTMGTRTGTWYGYDEEGNKLGWVSLKPDGSYILHVDRYGGLASIIGILMGIGVGLVSLTAIAAASSSAELFLLIIIY